MFPFQKNVKYSLVYDEEETENKKGGRLFSSDNYTHFVKRTLSIMVVLISTTALIYAIRYRVASTNLPRKCESPRVRREWRTLSPQQKFDYIDAVKCLQYRPSRLDVGSSLYDDFGYIHRGIGLISHNQPAFLSWHRYFVHIFDTRLRKECGYTGPMPYWNWVLDHEDPAMSPVFDAETGFGGNGDTALEEGPIGGGHCVTTGPFAMTIARYVNLRTQPHCLSRNFRNDTGIGHFSGYLIRPELIDTTLKEEDLLLFTLKLESGPHDTIPYGIRGDFMSFNAPADPLFFLHHAQLDRLWWKWQQMNPERSRTFSTRRNTDSDEMTSLDDVIDVGELGEKIRVSEIIDTQRHLLCYVYDDIEVS